MRRHPAILLVLAVFVAIYAATLATDVLTADNGEFQLVAAAGGLAHPPGFPLYTLLAAAFARLPLLPSPAVGVSLFSLVTTVATLAVIYAIVRRLAASQWVAATVAAVYGSATTVWAQATTANIRSLTALFAALAVWALVEIADRRGRERPATGWLMLFGLSLSFGFTHHLSLAFVGLILTLGLVWLDGPARWRTWVRPATWSLVGLLPLLLLPLRDPALRRWEPFVDYALARGFSNDFFYFRQWPALWDRLGVMVTVLRLQWHPLLLLLMVAGAVAMARLRPRLAVVLGAAFALHTLVTATYRAPQTVEYMLPAYVIAAVMLGGLGEWRNAAQRTARVMAVAAPLLLAGLAMWQVGRQWPSFRALRTASSARPIVAPLLDRAPSDAVILAHWHWATPLWYLQQVESVRPDVAVEYVFPRDEPYADTWRNRIAAEASAGRDVITTGFADIVVPGVVAEPLGEGMHYRAAPRAALPADYRPVSLTLGDAVSIAGYGVVREPVAIGAETIVAVAWRAADDGPLTLFAHLVDDGGRLVAQADVAAPAVRDGILLTQLRLTPRPGTQPGRHTVLVGAYRPDGTPLTGPSGDTRLRLTELSVVPSPWRPVTRRPLRQPQPDGRVLIGRDVDWTVTGQARTYSHYAVDGGYVTEVADQRVEGDTCRRRCHYVPLAYGVVWLGDTLDTALASATASGSAPASETGITAGPTGDVFPLTLRFATDRPLTRDIVVSAGLVGYIGDSDRWAWQTLDNGIPAMGGIPTLKWIAGVRINDPRRLEIDPSAEPNQRLGATLVLYDAFSGRTLTILDERIAQQWPWVPIER